VVLYWLLVDRRPFEVTEKAGVDALLSRTPVAPHAVNPRVPPELSELCLRLLEKAPEARPDAQAVCATLEALLERGETAWDTPLCEFHGVHNATTLAGPDADDEAVWRNEGREGARFRAHWRWGTVGLLLLVGVLGLAVARLRGEAGSARPAAPHAPSKGVTGTQEDWKVAPPWKPPEADAAVARPAPASTPAATASRAVPPEEAAPVKTPLPQPPRPSPHRPGATLKGAGVAACIAASGCASTPVYPPLPSAEPCPPRAVETMKALGIDVGDTSDTITWHLTAKGASYITLHEGWTSVRTSEAMGELPSNTILSGRLILSNPVQVRFVQAQPRGQQPVPVCMVAFNLKATPQPDKGPTAIRVFSSADVRAVDHFE
jgi:serine/threonine-protein kinase